MKIHFFSYLKRYGILTVKYSFFLFNLALLACLSIKTINLWIADPFVFADILSAFPQEPELENKKLAENQFWAAVSFETLLFIIGGFLCYELLIKQKTFRRNLIASIAIVFLWTAGESILLFFPATEKVHIIKTCQAMNISWDTKNHKCRLMDLELRRFESFKDRKKRPVSAPVSSYQKERSSEMPSQATETKQPVKTNQLVKKIKTNTNNSLNEKKIYKQNPAFNQKKHLTANKKVK